MLDLFRPFKPMEPKIFPEPFDSEDYGFQIKWDGTRILAHIYNNKIILFNRKKNERTLQYPEITDQLSSIFNNKQVILDGEIIYLSHGKPNFQELMRRDKAKDAGTIKLLLNKMPVTYIVFDILLLDGKELQTLTFKERDEILKNTLIPKSNVITTDTFPMKGKALFKVASAHNLEGIVAKKFNSPYQLASKTANWLKIKNWRTMNVTIGGYICQGNDLRSLLIGTKENEALIYQGKAAAGLDQKQLKDLFEKLHEQQTKSSPFHHYPKLKEKIQWVNPLIELVVEYLEFTEEGYLRQPVIKKILY
ncbi:RNA ligase family protein [Bacillota bacterium LX-D]|nr:RNA ligase family protein [Bacillota bacterium LX-D]